MRSKLNFGNYITKHAALFKNIYNNNLSTSLQKSKKRVVIRIKPLKHTMLTTCYWYRQPIGFRHLHCLEMLSLIFPSSCKKS